MKIPAGWYSDPASPEASLRWWDGRAWTTHQAPAPEAAPRVTQYGRPIFFAGLVVWLVSRVCVLVAQWLGGDQVDDASRAVGVTLLLLALACLVVGGVLWFIGERKKPRRPRYDW